MTSTSRLQRRFQSPPRLNSSENFTFSPSSPRFAAARTRENQERTVAVRDRLELGCIETVGAKRVHGLQWVLRSAMDIVILFRIQALFARIRPKPALHFACVSRRQRPS